MKVAVLDLGTNIFSISISRRTRQGFWEMVTKQSSNVELGKGGTKMIDLSAYERAMSTLTLFSKLIDEHKCDKIFALGTSAMRDAQNGNQLVAEATEKTGIQIEVIDGDREAELIYYGVLSIYSIPDTSLIMDIGGGSVEFIIAKQKHIYWKKSYDIGIQRLFDQFEYSDPISSQQLLDLYQYLSDELHDLVDLCQKHGVRELIGTKGTFETVYSMYLAESNQVYKRDNTRTIEITRQMFDRIHTKLIQSSLQGRKNMRGLFSIQADMIVIGISLIHFILQNITFQKIRISSCALKEGCLYLL